MQKELLILLAIAGAALFLSNNGTTQNLRADGDLYRVYVQWKAQYNHNMNASEDEYRFKIFAENHKLIQKINSEQSDMVLGINAFAAMTTEEFAQQYTAKMTNSQVSSTHEQTSFQGVPLAVDWFKKGAVGPVLNQGSCGSCWAFSAVQALQGIYEIKTGDLITLSAQQLVDCSTKNYGCSGGDPMEAFEYTKVNGIESAISYPYVSENGKETTCTYNKNDIVFNNIGQVRVSPQNEILPIQQAVVNQPLSIEVDAGNVAFQFYTEGVINSAFCGTSLDHGVLLTGYNTTESSNQYWTIKNSWGSSWGMAGYANIAIVEGAGMCGIQQYAAYPVYN